MYLCQDMFVSPCLQVFDLYHHVSGCLTCVTMSPGVSHHLRQAVQCLLTAADGELLHQTLLHLHQLSAVVEHGHHVCKCQQCVQ